MKKIFYILLFFVSCKSEMVYSQIVITEKSFAYSTTGFANTASATYTQGHLYLMYFVITNAGGTPATISMTGGVWTSINSIVNGQMRLEVFRYSPVSTIDHNIVFTYTGTQDGSAFLMYDITGADVGGTNGSNAIIQSATNSANATANPSVTLSTITALRNAVVSAFTNNVNPFGGTAESGWTENEDDGYSTPDTGQYGMYRLTTTDNTPTVTASASDWAGIAIEIKSAARRRIITD